MRLTIAMYVPLIDVIPPTESAATTNTDIAEYDVKSKPNSSQSSSDPGERIIYYLVYMLIIKYVQLKQCRLS